MFEALDWDGDGALTPLDLNALALALTGREQPASACEDELRRAKDAARASAAAPADAQTSSLTLSLEEFLAFSAFLQALPAFDATADDLLRRLRAVADGD